MLSRSGLVVLFLVPLLSACLSSHPATENELLDISDAVRETPRYQQAKQFDSFLKEELGPQEQSTLAQACRRKPSDNVFCFSVNREKKLRQFLAKEEKNAEPHFRQKPEPITPQLVNGKVKNWSKMQRANLKSLLSGMRSFSLEELKTVGAYALSRRECPNHIAVSTAALLEIHLPMATLPTQIAKLYEKGARCTRKRSPNHEHYLTRAALFLFVEKKFASAEKLLMRVQPMDAYSGRSLYWLYRSRMAQGKTAAARKTLSRLKNQFPLSFHALMANTMDKSDPIPVTQDISMPTRSKDSSINALIEQAETLHEMGFAESASKLVYWALTKYTPSDPGIRAYLASLGNATIQVKTVQTILLTRPALRNNTYFQLAYPKAYFELFSRYESQVDPYLLLAVARKESTLDPKAVSPANAQGLLQLNPDTAKRLSGEENPNLFDPKINTELAARYWQELREVMKGQLPLMIASYNAGEQTVAHWTQRYPTSELLLFMDLIPYRETRDYVGFVLANYFWYRRLYSDNPEQALSAVTDGQIAKLEAPRGDRAIKSVVEDAQKTSETWPEDPPSSPAFIDRWKENGSAENSSTEVPDEASVE